MADRQQPPQRAASLDCLASPTARHPSLASRRRTDYMTWQRHGHDRCTSVSFHMNLCKTPVLLASGWPGLTATTTTWLVALVRRKRGWFGGRFMESWKDRRKKPRNPSLYPRNKHHSCLLARSLLAATHSLLAPPLNSLTRSLTHPLTRSPTQLLTQDCGCIYHLWKKAEP